MQGAREFKIDCHASIRRTAVNPRVLHDTFEISIVLFQVTIEAALKLRAKTYLGCCQRP